MNPPTPPSPRKQDRQKVEGACGGQAGDANPGPGPVWVGVSPSRQSTPVCRCSAGVAWRVVPGAGAGGGWEAGGKARVLPAGACRPVSPWSQWSVVALGAPPCRRGVVRALFVGG